ncbi:MAG: tetratricopeptide repeat-containing sulfotransferase family protein [Fimbriimonadaceae bacterium]
MLSSSGEMCADSDAPASEAKLPYARGIGAGRPAVSSRLQHAIEAAKLHQSDQAVRLLRAELSETPDSVEAMLWLASVLREVGRYPEAIQHCERALTVEPDNSRVWFGLAQCHLDCWQNDRAIVALRRVVELAPTNAPAYDRLGLSLRRTGRSEEALTAFAKAVQLMPDYATGYANIGQLYVAENRVNEASAAFDRALDVTAHAVPPLLDLCSTYVELGNMVEAERAARTAIKVDQADDRPRAMLAGVLRRVGRFDEAAGEIRTAIAIRPNEPQYYFDLAYSGRASEASKPYLDAATKLVRQPGLSAQHRSILQYALGKSLDDLGEYGRAFQHFEEANGILARTLPPGAFDAGRLDAATDRTIELFTRDYFERHRRLGNDSEQPVFIVGMIRSGTTLVEQIISSHPLAEGAGELRYVVDHVADVVRADGEPDPDALQAFTRGYLDRLHFAAPHGLRITDKMPSNFTLAWFTHMAFPNARIVHCRRNPLDNCLSTFLTPYRNPIDYAHSLANIATFYKAYRRLMEHWRQVLPANRFIEIDYESLVTDKEPVLRRLIEFLGQPWDDACLSHQDNASVIDTPSRWQARQDIYRSSVGRWRNYEPWIDELIAAFPEEAN